MKDKKSQKIINNNLFLIKTDNLVIEIYFLNIVIEIFVYYKQGSTFKRPVIFYLLYLSFVIKSIVNSLLIRKEKTHKRT
jgi:hypothetical protein